MRSAKNIEKFRHKRQSMERFLGILVAKIRNYRGKMNGIDVNNF